MEPEPQRPFWSVVAFNGGAVLFAALFSLIALFGHDWVVFARMPDVPLFAAILAGIVAVPLSALLLFGLRWMGAARWTWPRQVITYAVVWILAVVFAITAAWLLFRAEASHWSPAVLAEVVGRTLWLGRGLPVLFAGAIGGWTAYLVHRRAPPGRVRPASLSGNLPSRPTDV